MASAITWQRIKTAFDKTQIRVAYKQGPKRPPMLRDVWSRRPTAEAVNLPELAGLLGVDIPPFSGPFVRQEDLFNDGSELSTCTAAEIGALRGRGEAETKSLTDLIKGGLGLTDERLDCLEVDLIRLYVTLDPAGRGKLWDSLSSTEQKTLFWGVDIDSRAEICRGMNGNELLKFWRMLTLSERGQFWRELTAAGHHKLFILLDDAEKIERCADLSLADCVELWGILPPSARISMIWNIPASTCAELLKVLGTNRRAELWKALDAPRYLKLLRALESSEREELWGELDSAGRAQRWRSLDVSGRKELLILLQPGCRQKLWQALDAADCLQMLPELDESGRGEMLSSISIDAVINMLARLNKGKFPSVFVLAQQRIMNNPDRKF